jgi:hypothetical protein
VLSSASPTILGAAKDREDAAHRQVDVDVGRAVEWVENQQIVAARVFGGDRMDIFHFLRCHRPQMPTPFTMVKESLVGQHIELLLHLALHVVALPSSPSTPASEPRETPCAIALQERTTSLMSIDRSPISAGLRRCSSIEELVNVGASA